MGKRQIRVFNKNISRQIGTFTDKELTFILKDNTMLRGVALIARPDLFEVRDALMVNHTVKVQDIEEIIFDYEAPF